MRGKNYKNDVSGADKAALSEEGRNYSRPDHRDTEDLQYIPQSNRQRQEIEETPKVQKKPKKKKGMNKQFLLITYLTVFLFLGLMAYMVYFNQFLSADFISSPYNKRLEQLSDQITRGSILSADGDVLARTVTDEDGNEVREYPYHSVFSHVVGYSTKGMAGLELTSNFDLLTSNAFLPEQVKNDIAGDKNVGNNVVTTLDTDLQQVAYDALGDNKGAVIAMDPKTGAILAMVSKPDFDPATVAEDWEALNNSEDSALLNRAVYGAYAPGSTFKMVTALSYIREHSDYNNFYYNCGGSITYGDTTIQCFDGTVHGEENLTTAFAYSCNSAFASMGQEMDPALFRETAEDLLFNKTLPGTGVEARKSQFQVDEDTAVIERMMTAMGQGETLVSPYHLALITSAIANDGVLMRPYLVDHIENYSGSTISSTKQSEYGELMTEEEASILQELMKAVVTSGTGYELSGASYSVAGKTGTAEYSSDKIKSHSWFTGYSNVDDPDLVVCVVVEGYDGNASSRSIPVAKAVFDAYYNR